MNRNDVLVKLNVIFRDLFDDEKIILTEETVSEDIEDWDSLGQVYLITEIEDEFGIVSDEKLQTSRSVSSLIDNILRLKEI